jgi:Cu/Ag efflux protein CusF
MRRKTIAAVAGAMLLAATMTASAATITASITYIDVKARIIVIDHRAFHVPTTIDIGVLKLGEQVTIVYVVVDGQLTITSVKVD